MGIGGLKKNIILNSGSTESRQKITLLFLFSFLFFFIVVPVSSQSVQKLVETGDKFFKEGDYFPATFYYQEAYNRKNYLIEIQHKLACSYLKIHSFDNALIHFRQIADKYSTQYPDASFYSAEILKNKAEYKLALFYYRSVLSAYSDTSYYFKKSLHELSACQFALKNKTENPSDCKIFEDAELNKGFFMYGIASNKENKYSFGIPLDKDSLSGNSRIFPYTNTSKSIQLLKLFDSLKTHISGMVFLSDNTIVFSACGQKDNGYYCALYQTEFHEKWNKPTKLPDYINQAFYTSSDPAIYIKDSIKYLIFSSNIPGGFGKLDIWFSQIRNDREFLKPENAGAMINSPANEVTPWYDGLHNTLFFSSEWFNNYGGYDVFSTSGTLKNWKTVTNAGTCINSSYNDYYFSKSADNKFSFVTSNKHAIDFDSVPLHVNKIFRVHNKIEEKSGIDSTIVLTQKIDTSVVFETQAFVLDMITSVKKEINLYFDHDLPSEKSTGNYEDLYQKYIESKNYYLMQYTSYSFAPANAIEEMESFFRDEIVRGMQDFKSNMVIINKILNQNNAVTIYIKAYTSQSGTDQYNIDLAQRRLNCVNEFLNLSLIKSDKLKIVVDDSEILHEDQLLDKKTDPVEMHPFTTRAAYKRKVNIRIEIN